MKALPVEFRHRVISLAEEGYSSGEIAEVLGTSAAWVRSIKQLHAAGESLEPKSRANKRRSLADREGERIRTQVAAKPSTTLEDLKRDLKLSTSISNLWYALQALKIRLKKRPSPPLNGRDPMWPSPARSGPFSRPASTRVD
jgi:transposase